jgi:hypothetical protein
MKYLFLSYLNRSGSTFLANQLSKMPEICVCPEADILYELLLVKPISILSVDQQRKYISIIERDKKWEAWKTPLNSIELNEKSALELFLQILETFKNEHFKSCTIVIFKHNYLYRLIEDFSCNINFYWLSLLRDPLAIFASQYSTISPSTGKAMSNNPLAFIEHWNSFYANTNSIRKGNYRLLKYENLIASTNKEMDSILKWIGTQNRWKQFAQNEGELKHWLNKEYSAIHKRIDKAPDIASLNKWENLLHQKDVAILKKLAAGSPDYVYSFDKGENILVSQFRYRVNRRIQSIKTRIRNYKNGYA